MFATNEKEANIDIDHLESDDIDIPARGIDGASDKSHTLSLSLSPMEKVQLPFMTLKSDSNSSSRIRKCAQTFNK